MPIFTYRATFTNSKLIALEMGLDMDQNFWIRPNLTQ